MDQIELIYWLQAFVCFVVVILLFLRGLHHSYKWFIVFLVVQACLVIAGALLLKHRNAYGWFYYYSAAFGWLTPLVAAIEAYSQVMRKHQGIAAFGRKVLYGSLVVALAVSALTLLMRTDLTVSAALQTGFSAERVVRAAMLIVWVLLVGFLVWFPVSLSRNTVLHCFLFALYFLGTTAWFFVYTASDAEFRPLLRHARVGFSLLCYFAWCVLLTRRGEEVMVRIGHSWNRAEEARLLAQLDAINEHLMSTSRAMR